MLMDDNKFIVVIGSISYGNPFVSLGRITNKVKLLLKKPDKVAAVVFTGGEDVDPSLYGGKKSSLSHTSLQRDLYEKEIFLFCKKHNIKQLSICRGIQFLGVMAGGKMYQHVENHAGVYHKIVYPALKESNYVNSMHHQIVNLSEEAIPIAWTYPNLCDWAINADGVIGDSPKREIEAAVFPKDNAMGVQFHPEMMKEKERGRIFYIKMVKDFLELNIDNFTSKYGYMKEKTKCETEK
jgi:putative glutamine amidotransferase